MRLERTGDLTESQKRCLRLVSRGMSSKEIAIETGWTPQTVDTYLKKAIAALCVSSRRDAARCLREAELSQKSGSPSPDLAPLPAGGDETEALELAWWKELIRPPPVGGKTNRLSWSQKSVAALRIAVIGAVTVIGLALLIAGTLLTFR